jgi:hypothetical protein
MVDSPVIPRPRYDAGSLSLSPDSHYLAFSVKDGNLKQLLVLDTSNQQIWDPCITDPYADGVNHYH